MISFQATQIGLISGTVTCPSGTLLLNGNPITGGLVATNQTGSFVNTGNNIISGIGTGISGIIILGNNATGTTGLGVQNSPSLMWSGNSYISGVFGTGNCPSLWSVHNNPVSGTGFSSNLAFTYTTGTTGLNFNTGMVLNTQSGLCVFGGIYQSGFQVVTTNQTGGFGTGSVITGGLTGIFWPLFQGVSTVSGSFNLVFPTSTYLVNTLYVGTNTGILPTAVGLAGYEFTVKDFKGNASLNPIHIGTTSSQKIDNSSSGILNINYQSMNFISDGSNWYVV